MHATNCPNCGAPITKPVCEYCGTALAEDGLVEHDTNWLNEVESKLTVAAYEVFGKYVAEEEQPSDWDSPQNLTTK